MANEPIRGMDLLIEAVGEKEGYDEADHRKARLPMVMACTRCTGTMAGAAALLYRRRDGSLQAYCGTCS